MVKFKLNHKKKETKTHEHVQNQGRLISRHHLIPSST